MCSVFSSSQLEFHDQNEFLITKLNSSCLLMLNSNSLVNDAFAFPFCFCFFFFLLSVLSKEQQGDLEVELQEIKKLQVSWKSS